jgi:molybdopterin molybdotransferase
VLTVEEARARVLGAVEPLEEIDAVVADALGLVLAHDVVAAHPLPRFDNSAMDGYAVVAADCATASEDTPTLLEVVGEIRAGEPGETRVEPGTAVRIMTGAALPPGADAVVPVEMTDETHGKVAIKTSVAAGRHVRPAGDDIDAGTVAVRAGDELGAGALALLASLGASPVRVHRRPKVAVVVTGDELVPPEADPAPGQIRDSNSIALKALITDAGAEPIALGPVADERARVVEAFERAAELGDLVVSSGGVAVGKYDFVKEVVDQLGGIDMWRVAMQPGKPVVLGNVKGRPFLGLPGNPVSIHVSFEQFVRPAIRKLRGCSSLLRPTVTATLTQPLDKPAGRLHFVRVALEAGAEGWKATPTGAQGSHIQSSLVGCHGVARFGKDETRLDAGADVVVEVWRLPSGSS